MFIYENGGFRKRFPEWRLLKTQIYRFSVDHNSLFKTNSIASAIGACISNRKNVRAKPERIFGSSFFSPYSVDGRKRCENASVDGELFIRFRVTKNGGFQKRISVDRAL